MKAAAILLACLLAASVLSAQNQPQLASDSIPADHMQTYSALAVDWMRDYLRINTTNPPGNEAKSAAFFKKIFDAEAIENQVYEFAPGRSDIWARVPCSEEASHCERPFILLNHMDVVSSEPSHWRVPPFSAEVVEGSIYGRGAQDMKNEGLAQAVVLVMLKREHARLNRDVIFLATGDEEVDDLGSKWFIAHKPELLGHAEYLLTEGGDTSLQGNNVAYVGVDIAEKAPFWLHVVAHGEPGHGSRPIADSAPDRLIAALNRIRNFRPEAKLTPLVEEMLGQVAATAHGPRVRKLGREFRDEDAGERLRGDPATSYMVQDTIAITMLGGSSQTNVIPNEAWANLDVRLLPGSDPNHFLEILRRVVNDPSVSIEPLKSFEKANSSPINTKLWEAIRTATGRYFNNAPVVPRLTSGYTESQLYRQVGIICYGFSAYADTPEEGSTEHGDNERVRIEEVHRAPRVLYDVVMQIAGR